MLQRIYTDDGQGNGRVAASGVAELKQTFGRESVMEVAALDNLPHTGARMLSYAIRPGVASLIGSRELNREFFNSMMDDMIAIHQGPSWLWNRETLTSFNSRLRELTQAPSRRMRYYPALYFLPAIGAIYQAQEYAIQVRDATETAIALLLWHRRHNEWPTDLRQLVPELLPAVPPDRVDGKPLRYRIRDGQPVLYSIGLDRDDDGGCPKPRGAPPVVRFGPISDEELKRIRTPDNDGDWILWPPAKHSPET